MCGILGIVSCKNKAFVEDALSFIAHRGPDDYGIYEDEYIGLGHRRLSIQDLSANGHQPMFSDNKRYVIIFNGEVYNHQEIREKINHKYNFKSTSDTETVLYGYIEYGTNLFNMLNGIFAFCIYDTQTKDLIIVRDQFGVKPLYYYPNEGFFIFSSEIKAFSNLPNFDNTLDYEALVNYIHFLWTPQEKTPFLKVKKLLPGHYIRLNAIAPNSFSVNKYYEIPFNGQYIDKTEDELIDELEKRLFSAVKRQLLSDVPVGFFLSGGLDSSAIVAMAKKALGKDVRLKCYTIDSGNTDTEGFANDLYYAKLVAKHLDVDLEIIQGKADIVKDFDKMIYHLDEPQTDAAPLHVLNICKKAREQGYVVLLGGTAGDDLFSGYRRHQALNFEKYFSLIPPSIRQVLKKIINNLSSKSNIARRVKKLLCDIDKTVLERMVGYYAWIDIEKNKKLFSKDIQEKISNYNPSNILINSLKNIPNESNLLNKMLYWDMKYFLTDHNLNYTDKLSMAVGVEVRVPFLDIELVEFSTMIPPHLKLKGKTTKYILKKLMERYLPKEVIYRSKSGFGAPVREWVLNELKPLIDEQLSEKSINESNVFDYNTVLDLINSNKKGKLDASYTVLTLLSIQSWIRQFKHEKKDKLLH